MMATSGDEKKIPPRTLAEHEKWSALRAASWRRLDEPERFAWAAFSHVDGQVLHRETFYRGKDDKDGEQFAVLEAGFVATVLTDWLGCPRDSVARAWAGVQVLHDLKWQGGRDHESLCWHVDKPLALLDDFRNASGRLHCRRCSVRFRCRECWVDGVWHSHGS